MIQYTYKWLYNVHKVHTYKGNSIYNINIHNTHINGTCMAIHLFCCVCR